MWVWRRGSHPTPIVPGELRLRPRPNSPVNRHPLPALTIVLALAAAAMLAFPASGLAVSQSPPKSVVGSGTINVPVLVGATLPERWRAHHRAAE